MKENQRKEFIRTRVSLMEVIIIQDFGGGMTGLVFLFSIKS